jgi:hypothetical protein
MLKSEDSRGEDTRIINDPLAEEEAADPSLAILRIGLRAEAALEGMAVKGVERQFAASLHTLRESLQAVPGVIDVAAGVLREEGHMVRGYVVRTEGLSKIEREAIKEENAKLVEPFPVAVIPQEFLDEGRRKWEARKTLVLDLLRDTLHHFSNVSGVWQAVSEPGSEWTSNCFIIDVQDPSASDMDSIKAVARGILKRPLHFVINPPDDFKLKRLQEG